MVVCLAVGRLEGLFHLLEAPTSFHPVLESTAEEGGKETEQGRDGRRSNAGWRMDLPIVLSAVSRGPSCSDVGKKRAG